MMLNKFLFAGLLATSALTMTSPATAGYDDENGQLSVSIRKLKYGYMNGEVTLNDGTKLSVTKPSYALEPNFTTLDKNQKLTTPVTNNTAYFFQEGPGCMMAVLQGYAQKYNESTQAFEDDLTQPIYKDELMPGTRFFDLDVKIISSKKMLEPKIEATENLPSKMESLIISKKEDVLEEKKTSNENTISFGKREEESSPVSHARIEYGGLVLSNEDFKKGAKAGTLKTDLGTLTFALEDTNTGPSNVDYVWNHEINAWNISEDTFYFVSQSPGMAPMWNEELQRWEEMPGMTMEYCRVKITLKKETEDKKSLKN